MDIENQIKKFNSDNLTSAIKTCYAKPSYRVLIAVPEKVKLVVSIVINRVRKLYPHEHSEFKTTLGFITFPNGSSIKITTQNDAPRGYRVCEVLLSDMSNTDLMQRLYPIIRDYEEERKWWDETSL